MGLRLAACRQILNRPSEGGRERDLKFSEQPSMEEDTMEEETKDYDHLLEQGEASPLLNEPSHYEEDASHIQEKPSLQCQTSDPQAPTIVLGFDCLESVSFFGISTNLVVYLSTILHENNASIAKNITIWTGTSFFTPFIGAFIADSYWGSYMVILVSSLMELTGMILITLSSSIPSFSANQRVIFYTGLYFIAFGSGGIKSSLLPLGADQFNDQNPIERRKKESFFNWFYFCINLGALASSTLIVWVQENVNWALGFGISTLCMGLAVGVFLSGSKIYRLQRPSGSSLKRVFQVLIASLRKMTSEVPIDSDLLYEGEDKNSDIQITERLKHTDEFGFLDKAAIALNSDVKDECASHQWRLCTVTQVEELKILLRLLPIWLTNVIYSIIYAQMYTTFVEQGRAMDTRIGSFSVPPASLFAFEVLSVMLWVFLYDMLILPVSKSYLGSEDGLNELQRMAIGYFSLILTMGTAAIVEMNRLRSVKVGKSMGIAWQLPQFFIAGGSEVFTYIGQLEFFYNQGPSTMRNMCTSFSLLTISVGNYLNSFVIALVAYMTTREGRPGWIPDNLDEGHLDYFFWTLMGVGILNSIFYLGCSKKYKLKNVIIEC